jgi:hypothetical protein
MRELSQNVRIPLAVEECSEHGSTARASALMPNTTPLLELGSGGGERLERLGSFPSLSVATESYAPNVTIAAERLTHYGVQMVWAGLGQFLMTQPSLA